MSWSTYLLTQIEFPRKSYTSLTQVFDDMDEAQKQIKFAKDTLQNLAFITEPQKFCGEEDDPMMWLKRELENAMEMYEESLIELENLRTLAVAWKNIKREGDQFAPPPFEEESYLYGDFIPSSENSLEW